MGFWNIYLPLVSALLTMEGIHLLMSYIFSRRHIKRVKEVEEKMRADGIDPTPFLKDMGIPVHGHPAHFDPRNLNTTVSGQGPHAREEHVQTGQYL
jgi:hypothetical protein